MKEFSLFRTTQAGSDAYGYIICGLNTRSDMPLTSVPTSARGRESVDVLIQFGPGESPMARSTGRYVFEHSADHSLIRIQDVADFEISGGRWIRVWPATGAAQKDIEIFLFGPAWASLCHQRRLLPLHASAIRTKRGIAAFAGHSGAGKSTTAALMVSLDYELVTDDVLPISLREKVPGAWPYLRRLKLHAAPIGHLALTPGEVVSERLDKEKHFVRPQLAATDEWIKLDRIYLLEPEPTEAGAIRRLVGAEAVRALVDQTYHFAFVLKSDRFRDHLEMCAHVASSVAIYGFRRSPAMGMGPKLASLIHAHLEVEPA